MVKGDKASKTTQVVEAWIALGGLLSNSESDKAKGGIEVAGLRLIEKLSSLKPIKQNATRIFSRTGADLFVIVAEYLIEYEGTPED